MNKYHLTNQSTENKHTWYVKLFQRRRKRWDAHSSIPACLVWQQLYKKYLLSLSKQTSFNSTTDNVRKSKDHLECSSMLSVLLYYFLEYIWQRKLLYRSKNLSLTMPMNLFTLLVSVIFHPWMTFEGFSLRNFKL